MASDPEKAFSDVERVLDQWLEALQSGGDKAALTFQSVLALTNAGAPPAMVREVSRLSAIAAVDKKIRQGGWSDKDLALFNAARAMLVANTPPEEIMPLIELHRDIGKPKGKKPRALRYRIALATFAAAVTVLAKGQTVDAAIAEVATPNRISRKDIKNLRDRLNRGLVSDGTVATYEMMVATFRRLTREEIMSVLSRTSEKFCT